MIDVNSGHLTALGVIATLGAVRPKAKIPPKQQLGVRVDAALVEAMVLAVRQRRRVNDLVEEAIRDLTFQQRDFP